MLLQDTVGFPDYFGSISGTSSKAVNVTWSRATEVTLMNGMFSHFYSIYTDQLSSGSYMASRTRAAFS